MTFANEKEIMDIAGTMVANRMHDLGYQYINLDGQMIVMQFVYTCNEYCGSRCYIYWLL